MFAGQSIVVTGGASGIGLALARQFGLKGARIVIGEPDEQRLTRAVERLSGEGVAAQSFAMDVTQTESVMAFADFAEKVYGRVDILINNAGISLPPRRMYKHTIEDVKRLFDVNVFGVWNCAAEFGRRMVERGEPARIYNVGSENSFFNAAPGMAAYIASKHAVRGLTEAMAEDMPDFIKVGLICPGFVKSELTPPPFGDFAMDTDVFAAKVIEQIEQDSFYIVTHAYNIERIRPIHDEIEAAYARFAPRYPDDAEFDVRTLIEKMRS